MREGKDWRRHAVKRPDFPLGWHLSRSAYLGLFLITRASPKATSFVFRDHERVLEALAHAMISIDDTVRVETRTTTVGRYLVGECLPPAFRELNEPCTAARLASLMSRITRDEHIEIAARSAEALEILGCSFADRSGASPAIDDFAPHQEKDAIVKEATDWTLKILSDYQEGLITDGERYNKGVDTWASATDRTRYHYAGGSSRSQRSQRRDALDVLEAMAATDREAPRIDQPAYLRGIRGLSSKSSGEIVETPVLHTLSEGLSAHEYMITAMSCRGATLSLQERDRVVATLLHDLDAVLSETKIAMRDCGTTRGVRVEAITCGFDTMKSLASRIEGRVLGADVVSRDGSLLAAAGSLLTRLIAQHIDKANVPSVLVRDPMTCEAIDGVCALCFGLDPDDATWPAEGDAVGTRAAMTIAREARGFADRWFHIC